MSEQELVVLFADISGSMQLYETIGDGPAKNLIVNLQQLLSERIRQNQGIVQEIIGDEVMARFDQPDHALRCATEIHQCAEQYGEAQSTPLMMRVGLHFGTAIIEQNRLFGDTVNLASRIAAIAQGGQTITTEALMQQAAAHWKNVARQFDITKVKGKSAPVVIYDLPWRQSELTTIKPVTLSTEKPSLTLSYNKRSVNLNDHNGEFSIGRALTNDLVVNAEPVSRRHTTIELIRDHYVVTDKSTNGTHVYLHNGEMIYLRRERLPVWGAGQLALGAPSDQAAHHVVEFNCQLSLI
ncbi:MAG: adenylate/guanylate cyclase domain-containing protein [Granulosicoccus sp.]